MTRIKLKLKITDLTTKKVLIDGPAHSFTKPFMQILDGFANGGTKALTTLDTGGVARTFNAWPATGVTSFCFNVIGGGITPASSGIVVGRDSTAESPNDDRLISLCAHGVALNEVNYNETSIQPPLVVGADISINVSRIMQNASGATIVLKEVGMYASRYNAASAWFFCIARDVIPDTNFLENHVILVEYVVVFSNTSPDSWTHAIAIVLACLWYGGGGLVFLPLLQTLDTSNTLRDLAPPGAGTALLDCDTAGGGTTYGLVVGTGVAAKDIMQYALQTPIAHGNGVGQLNYGATSIVETTVTGTVSSYQVTRLLTNNTAAPITIEEVGLYIRQNIAGTFRYFMVSRDLTGGVTINAGASKTVTVTISVDNAG
jgi:hypothetical protein